MMIYFNRYREIAKENAKRYLGLFLAKYFPERADRFFMILNKSSNYLYTYHKRPRLAKDFNLESDIVISDRLAIVIQGSLGADEFVYETVKIYKKIFPQTHILVSTWFGESACTIKKLEDAGAKVILNEKPKNSGISNVNMQIVSTRSGIESAKELGSLFVLKTRSDQRLYASNVYEYFRNILSIFPPHSELVKGRLISVSLNSFLYRMYGLSDMLMFGHVDDVLRFWSVKLDEREADFPFDANSATLREFAEWNVCEVYLTTEYLKSVGHIPKWTLEDSWDAFSKYFCIVDKESIDLFWNKYTTLEYRWLRYHLRLNVFSEITFRDWLRIYKNDGPGKPDESVLNQRIV
jgi:hypothetical protein